MQARHLPRFNPRPRIEALALPGGREALVIDDALENPDDIVDLAVQYRHLFEPAATYAYPGLELWVNEQVLARVTDFFAQHLRRRLGARRTLQASARLSMVTLPASRLEPRQWFCHTDDAGLPAGEMIAASVLYLFHEPALGGTSFYAPRLAAAETAQLIQDAATLAPAAFTARWGIEPGYQLGSNAAFEHVAAVPAAYNRLVFYDGGVFHCSDNATAPTLGDDPRQGRLTLNGFLRCSRLAA
jgi:hypothetical protein